MGKTPQKTGIFITAATTLLLLPSLALAATTTITVTSVPYLSFLEIPQSFIITDTPLTVSTADQEVVSDSGSELGAARTLTVKDNRNCGGYTLTMQAANFAPSASTLNDEFRVITSPKTTEYAYGSLASAGVNYLTGFTGTQGITAALNVEPADFSTVSNFTSFGSSNTLNQVLTLMDGTLLDTQGRDGDMNINLSFYLLIPKYQAPPSSGDQFYSTITFTLSDATTENGGPC